MSGLFISDCVRSAGLSRAACTCSYEKMAERYSFEELKALVEPQFGQVSAALEEQMHHAVKIMMYCQATTR